MTRNRSMSADELKKWQNVYDQMFTIDGQESTIENDGSKRLILLPMLTYTLISTMLQKLKYLPNSCFNRILIGKTPVCGLRSLNQTSPSLMYRLTEILRVLVDGVRKQHIQNITLIFYQKDNINTVYDSYSIVYDYEIKLGDDETQTSISLIAQLIHEIEYLFSWNDALPNDVELTFVVSALDQFNNKEKNVPTPFHFVKSNVKQTYIENETNRLMGRLTTLNGKILLKFLPSIRPLSGSSLNSEGLITRKDSFGNETTSSSQLIESNIETSVIPSPKSKKTMKKTSTPIEPNKGKSFLPSLSSISSQNKKKGGFLSTVKSLITPSRTPIPAKSSTPNVDDLVLIRHTSTPKPGETASRITIGGNVNTTALSAIDEVETPVNVRISSPTPSTITTTDLSSAATPIVAVQRRSTARGQAAIAREKIAAMQIRDDDDDDKSPDTDEDTDNDENEQFKKLFERRRKTKSKPKSTITTKKDNNLSDVSTISSTNSNIESLFTPPTARKRPTADRTGDDDLAAEHGTPPKTPRTGRRNRTDDQSSLQATPMDVNDIQVSIDSPRLLRSVTKKLQQQASAKKQLEYEEDEELNRVYVQLERSSIALHYSMDDSD